MAASSVPSSSTLESFSSTTTLSPSKPTPATTWASCCQYCRYVLSSYQRHNNDNNNNNEFYHLITLALPNILIQWSFVLPPAMVASHIGTRLGVVALDGYTLAWGTGNLGTMALLQGIFNACDTLLPQAVGAADHARVGVVAGRAWIAAVGIIIVPVNLLITMVPHLLQHLYARLGQETHVADWAAMFYQTYWWSFPWYALYSVLWKFCAAQSVMMPLVGATIVSVGLVLPTVLPWMMKQWAGKGAAGAFTVFYAVNCGIVVLWLWLMNNNNRGCQRILAKQRQKKQQSATHVINPQVWPKLHQATFWKEVMDWQQFQAFMALGVGGMLAYLEWAYWEVLTLIIGTFGVMPLSAHTVPRQVTDIGYVVPVGIGLALAIRLGATISKNVQNARTMAGWTLIFSTVVFGVVSVVAFLARQPIIDSFTKDAKVKELCNEIWGSACTYFFFTSLFGINLGVSLGLGMQWTFGMVTLVCMWLIGMPATYYFAVLRSGGLPAVWACIWPPYLLIDLAMWTIFALQDWDSISSKIRDKSRSAFAKKKDLEMYKKDSDIEANLGDATSSSFQNNVDISSSLGHGRSETTQRKARAVPLKSNH